MPLGIHFKLISNSESQQKVSIYLFDSSCFAISKYERIITPPPNLPPVLLLWLEAYFTNYCHYQGAAAMANTTTHTT